MTNILERERAVITELVKELIDERDDWMRQAEEARAQVQRLLVRLADAEQKAIDSYQEGYEDGCSDGYVNAQQNNLR